MSYVEILTESRGISMGRTSADQTIVVQFQLDPDTLPEYGLASFLGATDDVLALEFAYTLFPDGRWLPGSDGTDIFLVITTLRIEQVNNFGWWKATAEYKYDSNTGQGSSGSTRPLPGDWTLPYIKIGFSVGNRTKNITQSLELIDSTQVIGPLQRELPCFDRTGNAIGVSEDNITGADIYSAGLELQITAYYFPQYITFTFLDLLATMCPSVNSDPFLAYQPGEVLLKGCDGSATVVDIVPITFNVEIAKNIKDRPDPPFPDLTCDGHHLLDYRYIKSLDPCAQQLGQLPTFRFIHKVYEEKPFAALGFPTL